MLEACLITVREASSTPASSREKAATPEASKRSVFFSVYVVNIDADGPLHGPWGWGETLAFIMEIIVDN